jgi:hypothetical protein
MVNAFPVVLNKEENVVTELAACVDIGEDECTLLDATPVMLNGEERELAELACCEFDIVEE